MKLTLQFDCDNEAFGDGEEGDRDIRLATLEAARILRAAATKLVDEWTEGSCIDLNGNKVGEWRIES